jgi:hypothetical protein
MASKLFMDNDITLQLVLIICVLISTQLGAILCYMRFNTHVIMGHHSVNANLINSNIHVLLSSIVLVIQFGIFSFMLFQIPQIRWVSY